MRLSAKAFFAPKAGNKESEYEDACCPKHPLIGKESHTFRLAVADGATETSFSGVWATQVVRAFCKGQLEGPGFPQQLNTLRDSWLKIVSRRPLPWYAEEKVRSGAFAAVVGLTLKDAEVHDEEGSWNAYAVGDTCVFQLRKAQVISAFPICKSEDFNNSPYLLASRASQPENDIQLIPTATGTWKKGDSFYLMTDAIACWFLGEVERGHVPARELRDLSDREDIRFRTWLTKLRDDKRIRNDDVTILRIEIEE